MEDSAASNSNSNSNGSSSSVNNSTSKRPTSEQANKHLENLQKIDEEIISLLSYSSTSLSSLNTLDPSKSIDQSKAAFRENAESFYAVLERVTAGLRTEVKALQDAEILTTAVNAKAEWVGKQKEAEGVRNAEAALEKLKGGE
ncbi:mediator complex protein-domain-containing protein [Myxozyma melibiosi]|uniref:Mediator of RNA polymerase II transcription subunit 11 n=1 Tax=Myxozyma melibiosi TaxID=54550 RepID=A0ABR1FDA7_9ASCO